MPSQVTRSNKFSPVFTHLSDLASFVGVSRQNTELSSAHDNLLDPIFRCTSKSRMYLRATTADDSALLLPRLRTGCSFQLQYSDESFCTRISEYFCFHRALILIRTEKSLFKTYAARRSTSTLIRMGNRVQPKKVSGSQDYNYSHILRTAPF